MPDGAELDLLLSNYLSGHLSPAEREAFERRLARDPALRRELALARRICRQAGEADDVGEIGDPDAVWARLQPLVDVPAVTVLVTPHRAPRRAIWGIAATMALTVGAGLVWRVAPRTFSSRDAGAAVTREYATARGQRTSIQLSDGTRIVLGPASKLRVSLARGSGPRTAVLDGQAYFVVTHDARRPFAVRTSRGVVKDLGTRFTVEAYADDPEIAVAVAEGRVSLTAPGATGDSVALDAGDVGHTGASDRLVAERGGAVDEYFTWTEGRLDFRGTPLADVVVRLGRWYGLDVRLAEPALGRRRLAASFKEESAAEALRVVAATAGLRIEQHGTTVVLHSK